jgi:hypothetical protein
MNAEETNVFDFILLDGIKNKYQTAHLLKTLDRNIKSCVIPYCIQVVSARFVLSARASMYKCILN